MLKNKIFKLFSLSLLMSMACLTGCSNNTPPGGSSSSNTSSSTPSTYQVSFYVDGNLYGDRVTVTKGSTVAKPQDPTREQDEDYTYTFDNWYLNGSETPWNFETDVVNSNIDLFAEFDKVARVYDLVVYVLGGSSSSVYITEDEIARVETSFDSAHEGKETLFKFFPAMTNNAFNAKVQSVSVKPDVIISGSKMDQEDNALTLSTDYPKTKVGAGWFNSTSRYVAVYSEANAEHLTLASELYQTMVNGGPDFFTLDTESATIKVGETKTIVATLAADDNRTVVWTSANPEVATVENGVITAVSEGSTKVSATLGLVTIEVEVEVIANVVYDLVVFAQHGTSSSVYLTDEELELVQSEFAKVVNIQGLNIYWVNVKGLSVADFNASITSTIAGGLVIDVVLAGGNMDSSSYNGIDTDNTYGKVNVGAGWFESTNRRVAITEACDENMELAIKLYEMLTKAGPNYEGVQLSKESSSIAVGETLQLTATSYSDVTWTSSDNAVATVENGLVTAVAAGTATITATNADGDTAECAITVTSVAEQTTYDLVVYAHIGSSASKIYISEEEFNAIKEAFTAEGAPGYGKNIYWYTIFGVKNAPFGEAVYEAPEGEHVDVVIGSSGIKSDGGSCGLTLQGEDRVAVNASWYGDHDPAYVGVMETAYDSHLTLANQLVEMLKNNK